MFGAGIIISTFSFAQGKTYVDSIEAHVRKYVKEHEVVTGKDKQRMTFYPATEKIQDRLYIRKNSEFTVVQDGKFRTDKK